MGLAILLSAVLAAAASSQAERLVNCRDTPARRAYAEASDVGPLQFRLLYCQSPNSRSAGQEFVYAEVSPNGLAFAARTPPGYLFSIASVGSDHRRVRLYAGVRATGWDLSQRDPGFIWSVDSESLLSAGHPGTFRGPTAPLRLYRIDLSGQVHEFPPLDSSYGRLDVVTWISERRAVAGLDLRGRNYIPAQTDERPSLAIIDPAVGDVIDTMAVPRGFRPERTSVAVLPDGRVRVFSELGGGTLWTEGEPPAPFPNLGYWEHAVLSPRGDRLLVTYSHRVHLDCSGPSARCRRGPPIEAPLYALFDLPSGTQIWMIRGQVPYLATEVAPRFSPDGRHALVPLHRSPGNTHPLGLVAMDDGTVLQVLNLRDQSDTFGFANEGATVWTAQAGEVVFYDFR